MKCILSTLLVICCLATVNGKRAIKSICCICDDFSTDTTEHCKQDTCDTSHQLCDVCETRTKFTGNKWYTTRTCTTEAKCTQQWYHTITMRECTDNTHGEPADGTSCYKCCKVQGSQIHSPFYCVDNPDTNYVNFTVTFPTTAFTTPTSPTTTPTTTPTTRLTTPTTTLTTAPTTRLTTPTPTTTPKTTPTTTTLATTVTTQPPSGAVICETCLTANCTTSTSTTCGPSESYCMNTVVSDGKTSTIKKTCATEMECYYDGYVAMKYKPECAGATGSTSQQSSVCHYCCEGSNASICNHDSIPKHQATFDNNGNPSHNNMCEVGRDGHYQTTTCSDVTPYCMNTVILQTNVSIIKKTCESMAVCNHDWWKLTTNRSQCMQTNSSMLPITEEGLVCHYCCKSRDGQPCNTDLIPQQARDVIIKSVNGGWSDWSPWTGCSQYCTGIQVRNRQCNNPVPGINGNNCHGSASEQENCDSNTNCKISATGSQALIG